MDMGQLNRLEADLTKLKTKYEQYFAGVERIEPADERKRLQRAIDDAASEHTPNTAIRFRAQNLRSRMITFEQYWNRILKQIEDGTYKRHQFKTRIHDQMRNEMASTPAADSGPATGGDFDNVVNEYRKLQAQAGASPVEAAKLQKMLQKQEQQLRQQYNAKKVEFRVVVEDGKPKLKAKPIR